MKSKNQELFPKSITSKNKKSVNRKKLVTSNSEEEKSLIIIDQKGIRKEAIGQCQKTLRKIDRAKKDIDQFEKVDRPAYERWIQDNFGLIIKKIKEDSIEIMEKRALIDEVQEEAFIQKITFIEAYKVIIYKREHPEEFETISKKKIEEDSYFNESDDFEGDFFKEDLNDFYRNSNMNEEDLNKFRNRFKNKFKENDLNFDSRLKDRYRLIVQKLHPDKRKKSIGIDSELWYEAQEAYKEKDLEKLDFIITLYTIKFGEIGIDNSIFDLKFANSKLEKALKNFSNTIRRAKNEPSWLFLNLKPNKLEALKKEASKEFKEYEKNTSTELKEIRNILDKWEKAAKSSLSLYKEKRMHSQKVNEDKEFLNYYASF